MKSFHNKIKITSSTVAALIVVGLVAIPAFAVTGPTGTPPTGNVNANFTSVTMGGVIDPSIANGDANIQGKIYNSNPGAGVQIQDNEGVFLGGTSVTVNPGNFYVTAGNASFSHKVRVDEGIYNGIASAPVNIYDSDGLSVNSDAGIPIIRIMPKAGDYRIEPAFTGNFVNPFAILPLPSCVPYSYACLLTYTYPSLLTDFNTSGGLIVNGGIATEGIAIKSITKGGLALDVPTGGITLTTDSGGETIFAKSGGFTLYSETGGLTVDSQSSGINAISHNTSGVAGSGTAVSGTGARFGVYGYGPTGVAGSGTTYGVAGSVPGGGAVTTAGVAGTGPTGVGGIGTIYGVAGAGPTGVEGLGTVYGVEGTGAFGVKGHGTGGVWGHSDINAGLGGFFDNPIGTSVNLAGSVNAINATGHAIASGGFGGIYVNNNGSYTNIASGGEINATVTCPPSDPGARALSISFAATLANVVQENVNYNATQTGGTIRIKNNNGFTIVSPDWVTPQVVCFSPTRSTW